MTHFSNNFLDLKVAFSSKARTTFKELSVVACIGNINMTQLAYEWRVLPHSFTEKEKESLTSLNIEEIWAKILECENSNDNKSFPNLEKLVEAILSLPHSKHTSEAERIFSFVVNVKNEKRNKLGNDTLLRNKIIFSNR